MADDSQEIEVADIPDEFKGLRACLRCGLIKTFTQVMQFYLLILFFKFLL